MRTLFFTLWLTVLFIPAACPAVNDSPRPWYSTDDGSAPVIHFYFFASDTCEHCREAKPFIARMIRERSWARLHFYSFQSSPDYAEAFQDLAARTGGEARYVPAFFFCERMKSGYADEATSGRALAEVLDNCYEARLAGADMPAPAPESEKVSVPFVGELAPETLSLPVLTLILAGLDAFNPCAFFVLLFLLSLLIHARSRFRILAVGGVYVFFSALLYFLFMAAWLNLFLVLGEQRFMTLGAGAVALVLALINIKDYFFFKRGVSLSIPEKAKPGLFARMRTIVAEKNWMLLLPGTAVLALAANSYELLCTAGFPMVYTRILTMRELSTPLFYLYLLFYNVIYVLPLLTIVIFFAVRFGQRKLQEKEGRTLKLLSGLMMLGLAVLLLAAPDALNRLWVAALLLAAACALTFLVRRFVK